MDPDTTEVMITRLTGTLSVAATSCLNEVSNATRAGVPAGIALTLPDNRMVTVTVPCRDKSAGVHVQLPVVPPIVPPLIQRRLPSLPLSLVLLVAAQG
jgi:hypothetical protein